MKPRHQDVGAGCNQNQRKQQQDESEAFFLTAMVGPTAKAIFVFRFHGCTKLKNKNTPVLNVMSRASNNRMGFQRKPPLSVRGLRGSSVQRRNEASTASSCSCAW